MKTKKTITHQVDAVVMPHICALDALEVGFQLGIGIAKGFLPDGREVVRWTCRETLPPVIMEEMRKREHIIHWLPQDQAIVALKQMLRELCGA